MPRALSLNSSLPFLRKKNISDGKKGSVKTSSPFLSIFLVILIIGCFVLYLYFNLQIVTINFELRTKEEELRNLEKESKKIETRLNEPFSIETLKNRAKELGLVRTGDIRYLELGQNETLSFEKK